MYETLQALESELEASDARLQLDIEVWHEMSDEQREALEEKIMRLRKMIKHLKKIILLESV